MKFGKWVLIWATWVTSIMAIVKYVFVLRSMKIDDLRYGYAISLLVVVTISGIIKCAVLSCWKAVKKKENIIHILPMALVMKMIISFACDIVIGIENPQYFAHQICLLVVDATLLTILLKTIENHNRRKRNEAKAEEIYHVLEQRQYVLGVEDRQRIWKMVEEGRHVEDICSALEDRRHIMLELMEERRRRREERRRRQKVRFRPLEITVSDIFTDDKSCSICLEIYSEEDRILKLNCGHCFHRECVEEWFEMKKNCPYCKQSIYLAKNHHAEYIVIDIEGYGSAEE